MADVTTTRKQRLRTLESQIRSNYEAFVQTGFALKEIRDDELYREDGFATWDAYLKERVGDDFGIERTQAFNLIACAQVRAKLPAPSSSMLDEKDGWSQRELLEFARLAPASEDHGQRRDFDRLSKRDVERVARKVIEHCEEQDTKPTAPIVRKFVDEELGIDRTARAKEAKQRRAEEEQEAARRQDEESLIENRINDLVWHMKQHTDALSEFIAEVGGVEWKQWKRSNQILVKRLTAACDAFTALLKGM